MDTKRKEDPFLGLRKQAEKILDGRKVEEADPDFAKLIHELEVYQVELELQNEELRRTQKDLEASRNEYYALFDSAPVGFVIIDASGTITRVNRTAEEMLSSHAGPLKGQPFSKLVYLEDTHLYSSLLMSLGRHHKGATELRMIGSRGLIHVRIEATAKMEEEGVFSSWHFAITDVTERKHAEEELREAHKRALWLARFPDQNPNPALRVSADGSILYCNPSAEELPGWTCAIGEPLDSRLLPVVKRAIAGGQEEEEDIEIGRMVYSVLAVPFPEERYANVYGRDITERKQMENALRKSRDELALRVLERTAELEKANKEMRSEIEKRVKFEEALKASSEKVVSQFLQRKALSHKLVQLLEKDRKDVAMTLHDEVGSILTGAKIELEAIELKLAESPAVDEIAKVKKRMFEVMGTVRNISSSLRPTALDRFGLLSALTSLTEEVAKRSGIKINVHVPSEGMPERLSPEKELALYRIIQESLTNTVKHGEATEVFISLSSRNNRICLSVEDDGKGFSYEELGEDGLAAKHLGISIMRERVSEFDGEFRVQSTPGKGTHVMVELPV
jgi:PAS domain S-box-containing protein